jgi:hypothetical protein
MPAKPERHKLMSQITVAVTPYSEEESEFSQLPTFSSLMKYRKK